jgi:hypothetical protein
MAEMERDGIPSKSCNGPCWLHLPTPCNIQHLLHGIR